MGIDLSNLLLVFNAEQNKAYLVLLGEAAILFCSTMAMALNCTGWIPMVWVPSGVCCSPVNILQYAIRLWELPCLHGRTKPQVREAERPGLSVHWAPWDGLSFPCQDKSIKAEVHISFTALNSRKWTWVRNAIFVNNERKTLETS